MLAWLAALVDETNAYYFAYVAPTLSDEAATSWRDLRGQQFASGAVTQKLYGVASVLSLQIDGVVVAPELPVYAAASDGTISMTAAEANAFLDMGSLHASLVGDGSDAYLNQYLPYDFLLKGFVVGYQRDGMTATTDPTGLDTRPRSRSEPTAPDTRMAVCSRAARCARTSLATRTRCWRSWGGFVRRGAQRHYDDGALRLPDRQAPHE